MNHPELPELVFVTCASNVDVLQKHLLRSPCLRNGRLPLTVHFNEQSPARGFNMALQHAPAGSWVVWVHQDVFLPEGWDLQFRQAIAQASIVFPGLAIAGVYGVAGAGIGCRRAGHVWDRGSELKESEPLPCRVDSLDELLFAVRAGSQVQADPALGFDFYATDLVLQAAQQGLECAVVHAPCEHWSDTPRSGAMPKSLVDRVLRNGAAFENKWKTHLPISTPCFDIGAQGDVARAVEYMQTLPQPAGIVP